MTTRSPGKTRAATDSRVRKTALVGAAATALLAAAPHAQAAPIDTQATTLQNAVRNTLRPQIRERMRLTGTWDALNASKPAVTAA